MNIIIAVEWTTKAFEKKNNLTKIQAWESNPDRSIQAVDGEQAIVSS